MVRNLLSELRLYVTNHIVSNIPSHGIRNWYLRHVMNYRIGYGTSIFMGCWFDSPGNLEIGTNTAINESCRLDSRGGLTIGNNVSISAAVIILTASHDMNSPMFLGVEKPVDIGNFAFVGTRAMILPGVTIGEGAVIAAGAVVTRSVEPFMIVAGVPAKAVGFRTSDLHYEPRYDRLFH